MNYRCPNQCNVTIQKFGYFFRKSDSKTIQRFKCTKCTRIFSTATFSDCFAQKKRRVNPILFKLLASGISMRRAGIILNIQRMTVKRKLIFLAKQARLSHKEFLKNLAKFPIKHFQFDDLITSHHTKLKPLTVSLAVDVDSRKILAASVAQIPAFGHLATISRAKYGARPSNHKQALSNVFEQIKNIVKPNAKIESDEHKLYPHFVKKYFPDSHYIRHKSIVGCVAGQGELKRTHFDPLFKINHTFAMLRANINRLFRRTWCTTKDPQMLMHHLQLYIEFHNSYLV